MNIKQSQLSRDYESYQEPEIRTYKLNGDLSEDTHSQTLIFEYVEVATNE